MIVDVVLNILEDFKKRYLDMDFEKDKSLRQLHLAMKHVVNEIMPCVVNEYIGIECNVIWVVFGKEFKTTDWYVKRHEELPSDLELLINNNIGGYNPGKNMFYCVLNKETSEFPMTLRLWDMIYHLIKLKFAEPVVNVWDDREKTLFSEIGYKEWKIKPFPENPKPCPQMSVVLGITDEGKIGTPTYQAMVSGIYTSALLKCVPQRIFEVLNRCAKLCIWGYQDWEFFTMSEHYSTMSIETSLKALYISMFENPLKIILENRKTKEQIIKERSNDFSYGEILFLAETLYLEKKENWYVKSINNEEFRTLRGRGKNNILQLVAERDLLSPGEINDLQYPFRRRNYLSHPSGTDINFAADSLNLFSNIVTMTNRLWMRFLYPEKMIWQNSWYKKPRWAYNNRPSDELL